MRKELHFAVDKPPELLSSETLHDTLNLPHCLLGRNSFAWTVSLSL
jgi:hypothetical protein